MGAGFKDYVLDLTSLESVHRLVHTLQEMRMVNVRSRVIENVACMMQEAAGFKDFALDLKNPDFVKYAEAYGAKGYRIQEVCVLSASV